MTEPREWTIAVLASVAIGVLMAAASAPQWSYPVALAALIAAVVLYSVVSATDDDCAPDRAIA